MSFTRTPSDTQWLHAADNYFKTGVPLWCILLCLVTGCNGPSGSGGTQANTTNNDSVLISKSQAQYIAEESIKKAGAYSFELSRPTLKKRRYWQVVTEAAVPHGKVQFTNYISDALSRQEAKSLVSEVTKVSFDEHNFKVKAIDFVESYYWSIAVWDVPHVPGGERILYISARDGTMIYPMRIEPSPSEWTIGTPPVEHQ